MRDFNRRELRQPFLDKRSVFQHDEARVNELHKGDCADELAVGVEG